MSYMEELLKEYEAAKKDFQNRFSEKFKEGFKEFFEANPTIETFQWPQYTPYFNDGEPCTFGVLEPFYSVRDENGNLQTYGEYEEEDPDSVRFDTFYKFYEDFMHKMPEEFYQEMFGEGLVTVSRTGVEVSDFDHD